MQSMCKCARALFTCAGECRGQDCCSASSARRKREQRPPVSAHARMHAGYNRRLSLCTPCMHHSQPPTHFSTENLGQLGASTAFQNILTFQYSVRLYVPKASGCLPSRPYCTVSGTGISSGFSSPRSLAYAAMISVIETCTGKSLDTGNAISMHTFRPLLQALARSAPVGSDMWDAANVFK